MNMLKKVFMSLMVLSLAMIGAGKVHAEEVTTEPTMDSEGIMLINETDENVEVVDEMNESDTDTSGTGRGENSDDGDPTGKASDRDGNFICADGQPTDSLSDCPESSKPIVAPESQSEAELWPVIVSAAAIGTMLLAVIIINLVRRK